MTCCRETEPSFQVEMNSLEAVEVCGYGADWNRHGLQCDAAYWVVDSVIAVRCARA